MLWSPFTIVTLIGGGLPAIRAQQAAMMRFACSQLVVERLDPLVSPGIIGSPHTHQIVGGNSFNATMKPLDHDLVAQSTCTSCTFSEDFSNYWTAALYYQARNGTFKRVAQFENSGLKQNGGITGFRMLAGNPMLRSTEGESRGICHRCFGANFEPFGGAPCTGNDTTSLPSEFCAGGIRTTWSRFE
ncbi:hypothetical protein DL95DRAFT_473852 [Leptodontidium sp. 2 PMI_412]|nr:hypothetical protein DL95DRAFT_473852 [Leptodontidium sp. 2 PMI_412]